MTALIRIGRLVSVLLISVLASRFAHSEPAAESGPPSCATPPTISAIEVALAHSASRIRAGRPLTIVAIGSSSTLGVGASGPAMSYPSRLEEELKERFPEVDLRVINHGVGGQDVPEEVARLDRDVLAERPDLVIWQLGTNAVLRRDDLSADEQQIRRGVSILKEHGMDVILMDLQYAPRVLARPATEEMERLIADVARNAHVGLFRRFEIMREWDHTRQLAPAAMISPDGLHMTNASYSCLANQLAEALGWNWWSQGKLAKSAHRAPDALAGIRATEANENPTLLRHP
ncbi:MAG: SGNH/GDSL hydrolase family protein [Stellaceae bacterium]